MKHLVENLYESRRQAMTGCTVLLLHDSAVAPRPTGARRLESAL
jgi:hypothetical protein